MSKLFDKIDHAWELAQIDRAEQQASGSMTGFELARLDDVGQSERYRLMRSKTGSPSGNFQKLRARSRMKLLKTGQLMSDLRRAMSIARGCPKCDVDGEKTRTCDAHRSMVRGCIMAVKYAGEDNMPTRLAQGRVWGDEERLPAEERGLNKWEKWYYEDRRAGIWPGDATWAKREFGSLDYRGWLEMVKEESEIPYEEYLSEKRRLSA